MIAHQHAEQQHALATEQIKSIKANSADVQQAVTDTTVEEKHAQAVHKRTLDAKKKADQAVLDAEHSSSLAQESLAEAQKTIGDVDSVATELELLGPQVTTIAQAGRAAEAKGKQAVQIVVDEEASLVAELDRRTNEVSMRQDEVKEWEEKVTNWATKQKEDKAKWQRDIADATDVIEPAENTRKVNCIDLVLISPRG